MDYVVETNKFGGVVIKFPNAILSKKDIVGKIITGAHFGNTHTVLTFRGDSCYIYDKYEGTQNNLLHVYKDIYSFMFTPEQLLDIDQKAEQIKKDHEEKMLKIRIEQLEKELATLKA